MKNSSASEKKISLWLHGLNGRMGSSIQKQIGTSHQFTINGGSGKSEHLFSGSGNAERAKKSDLILDFTSERGNQDLFNWVNKTNEEKFTILIGSTGLSKSTQEAWKTIALSQNHKILLAPNTSLGCFLTLKAALEICGLASENNFDIELIETHHRNKIDQPSGTALYLANSIAKTVPGMKLTTDRKTQRQENELGIHAVRGGGVAGEHQIRFISEDEEISISHRAFSRQLFANGALILAKWLHNKEPGFYTLEDIDL